MRRNSAELRCLQEVCAANQRCTACTTLSTFPNFWSAFRATFSGVGVNDSQTDSEQIEVLDPYFVGVLLDWSTCIEVGCILGLEEFFFLSSPVFGQTDSSSNLSWTPAVCAISLLCRQSTSHSKHASPPFGCGWVEGEAFGLAYQYRQPPRREVIPPFSDELIQPAIGDILHFGWQTMKVAAATMSAELFESKDSHFQCLQTFRITFCG